VNNINRIKSNINNRLSDNNINLNQKINLISLRSKSIDYFNLKRYSIRPDSSSFDFDKFENIKKDMIF
jgi:hypothetical protein